jgi:sulfatase maturation enzyme AslB (radical SAM superfamily)
MQKVIDRIRKKVPFKSERRRRHEQLLHQSEVFCMAPWVHQYMFPDGRVFPCCIAAQDINHPLGNLSKGETLEQIWNSEQTKALRRDMLHGQKNSLCKNCYKYQALGKKSSREEFNEMFAHHIDLVDITGEDGNLKDFGLKFIDFRFSNICNLRCRTCSHHFSNKWFEESKLMGFTTGSERSIIYPVKDIDDLWQQVEPIVEGLERVHFAGGEPLVMEEHYRILEQLIARKKSDVQLTYNTNFADFKYKQYDVFELWSKFKDVTILASLDAMGERGEYMRKGINWASVEENRIRLMSETPHVQFKIIPTVSIMNVLHLPDFYLDWLNKGFLRPRDINIYLLFEPYFYNIITLPQETKGLVNTKYQSFFSSELSMLGKADKEYVVGQFNIVLKHMMNDPEKMSEDYYSGHTFKTYNGFLDLHRKESFADVFPELRGMVE